VARDSGIDTIARVDSVGPLEGHGIADRAAEGKVKKGKLMQVGTDVDLTETAYSPNRKSGTASGTGEY
jgi:hypothetical protein